VRRWNNGVDSTCDGQRHSTVQAEGSLCRKSAYQLDIQAVSLEH